MTHIPTPRLLPLTIFALSSLLAVKSVTLVRAAVGGPAQSDAQSAAQSVTPSATQSAPPAAAGPPASRAPAPAAQGDRAAAAPPATQPPAAAPPAASAATPPALAPAPAISEAERTLLLQLRQRSQQLDARDTAQAAREATLAAAELRLTARVGELQALQHKLEDLEQARQQREDASWQGLVKLYESMKPRDAATIFNDLDTQVLLGVVDRMKDAKAAPVLAAMQPDKARELTTKLAALRVKRAAVAQAN